jgi:hypothetical protein
MPDVTYQEFTNQVPLRKILHPSQQTRSKLHAPVLHDFSAKKTSQQTGSKLARYFFSNN